MKNKIDILKFERTPIRVHIDEHGCVIWICLNDILKSLDRMEIIENGSVTRLCRGVLRMPFKEGGRNRWGIKPFEIHYILRNICSENSIIAKRCRDLEQWLNSLPIHIEHKMAHPPLAKESREMVIFNYQDRFPITFKSDNGKTFINATQMAGSFNKYPAEWLRLASTIEFRTAMVNRGEAESMESQIMTTRGHNGATWIEESLAMEFARWLSPDFSAWCNSKIRDLVNNGYVSMRPPHTTTPPSETVASYPVPQSFEEALMLAAQQAKELRESAHKVSFYDSFVENRDCFKSQRIADELEISVVMLNRFLAENSIVKFENRRWVVHAPYRPLQCDVPYMWERSNGKVYPFGSVKRWTQAGREFIIELWQTQNVMR